ncbi:MAG: VOC family protein [Candidatus Hydrogenedentes bacterium]|nr:VOC family protein [Candidatus Hydrogenedentota bacterium]
MNQSVLMTVFLCVATAAGTAQNRTDRRGSHRPKQQDQTPAIKERSELQLHQQAWYQETFGGEPFDSFKGLPIKGLDYGDVLVMVQHSSEKKAPTEGRSIDHLGFSTPDLDAAADALKAKGVTFSINPMPYYNMRISFLDGPDGVRIEYVQPASE